MNNELYHRGIKGQKWGVRRYQYADGSLTSLGQRHRYEREGSGSDASKHAMNIKNHYQEKIRKKAQQITGNQYTDSYLNKHTTLSRIQTSDKLENHAFYATYKKDDIDKYYGLFGANLTRRAKAADPSSNVKTYQLKISATKKLKIPSDENAGDITAKLLKEKQFKNDVEVSIKSAKEKMKRPAQQLLFKQAQQALSKNAETLTSSDKVKIYKALNLSLTNHGLTEETRAQERFYSELKKKGYSALLDYNDKTYSSYHAKRPMIVFDTDSVALQSIAETNPNIAAMLNTKYTSQLVAKEIPEQVLGTIYKIGSSKLSDVKSGVDDLINKFLMT